jgi:hypothetical protein
MLAIVKSAANIRGPLLYNEHKVEQKQALFLDAHNFLLDKDELTMRDKVQAFQHLTELNERSRQNTIHISVNFPETDRLSEKQLVRITDEFMRGIGFADQPWLLYQHLDAGHPHVHVVTTNIRPDGSRISNDLRSPHHLKQLCFTIEQARGLTPAIPMPDLFGIEEPLKLEQRRGAQKAVYGEKPTKTQLENVLHVVNKQFYFTSFEAYNAALSLYNVRADRGREDSPMYRNGGLYYRMIDEEGRKLGAPIKASAFHEPVTLQKLEQKFILDLNLAEQSMDRLRLWIDLSLQWAQQDYSLQCFVNDLQKESIEVVIPAFTQRISRQAKEVDPSQRKPDDGHGIFFVDYHHMTVTRDTDLGSDYTAAAILKRTGVEQELRQLLDQGKILLSKRSDKEALKPDYSDTAETRRVLFKLSPQHDEIVENKLEQQRQEELELRQGHYIHHSL